MNYILTNQGSKINTNVQTDPVEYDEPLSESSREYYTGLTENALDITMDDQIATVGDLTGSMDYINTLENEDNVNDTVSLIESLAAAGEITPKEARYLMNRPPYPREGTMERMQAKTAMNKALVEDNDKYNLSYERPDDIAKQERFINNVGYWQTISQQLQEEKEKVGGGVGYFLRGWLTGVDVTRGAQRSLTPGEIAPYSYDVHNTNLIVNKMKELPEEEFRKYADGAYNYLKYVKKMDVHNMKDTWDRVLNPNNENFVSTFFDVFDVTLIGKGVKAAVKGAEKGHKIAAGTKALVSKTIEAQPFGTTAKKIATGAAVGFGGKAYKKMRSFAVNNIGLKLATGNYEGAAAKIAQELEEGIADVEDAVIAGQRVYDNIVDFAFKAGEGLYPQAGRHQTIQKLEDYYENAASLSSDLAENLYLNKYYDEIMQNRWTEVKATLPNMNNVTQISEINPIVTATNRVKGRFVLGNAAGVPFASRKEAENALKRWRGKGPIDNLETKIVETAKGTWFIEAEADFGGTIGEIFKQAANQGGTYKPSLLLGIRGTIPTRLEDLRNLANIDQETIRHALKPYQDAVRALSKDELAEVEVLKRISSQNRVWFTPEYLLNSGYSERVVQGYMAARMIEDIEYSFKGIATSKMLSEEGWRKIVTDPNEEPIIGRQIDIDTADYDGRWFVKGDGTEPLKLTRDDFTKGQYKNYNIVEPRKTIDNVPARKAYLLVDKEKMMTYDLDPFFGSYIPGFRWFYDENAYFIKQPLLEKLPNGRRIVSDIITLGGSMNPVAARGWAKEIEDIRSLVADFLAMPHKGKSIKGKIALDNIIRDMPSTYKSFNSTDDFIKFAKERGISLDPKATIGVVKEGDDLSSFRNVLKNTPDEETEASFEKFLKANRYSSYSDVNKLERGKGVIDIETDSQLPWVDLNEELKRVIRNTERFGSTNRYTELFANDWYDTFADIIPSGVDPVTALAKGVFKQGADPKQVQQAKYAKALHDYIKGVPNPLDKAIETWAGGVLQNIGESVPWLREIPLLGAPFKEGSRTYNMITKLTPLNYLRTFTAHFYLGMCNVRQAVVQALASANIAAMSPKASARALPYALVMPALLQKADKEALTLAQKMIKNCDETLDVSKLDIMIDNLKRLGVLNQVSWGGALEGLEGMSSKLSKTSLWLFHAGESVNRSMAGIVALMENGLEGVSIAKLSTNEIANLVRRMNDLYMNMGKTGVSLGQMSGIGKTLLQMKSYQLRTWEAMFNKALTTGERARLALFNLLATGVEGTIGASVAYHVYDWMTDAGVSDEVALAIQEGALNTLSRQISDKPINIGSMMSPEVGNLVEDLFNVATQGPIKYIAGSSAAGKTWQSISAAANVFSLWANKEVDVPLLKNTFRLLAAQKSLPSSLNNIVTAAHIITAGRKLSASGYLIGEDLGPMHAVGALLGIPLLAEKDFYEEIIRRDDYKNKVENAFDDLKTSFGLLIDDPTSSFNIDFFSDYFAIVCSNYELDDLQRVELWKRLMKSGMDRDTEYARKIGEGILKIKGPEKTETYLKARGY